MRRTLTFGAILLVVFPFSGFADDIAGTYSVSGFDTINKPYSTTATITMTGDAKCRVELAMFSSSVVGDCMVTGAIVAVHTELEGGHHSMGIYTRGADGVLTAVGPTQHTRARGARP